MRTLLVFIAIALSTQGAFAGSSRTDDSEMIFWARPKVMGLISTAKEVYIFPVATPLRPRQSKQLRLLDPIARDKIEHILGNEQNWFHGFDNRIRMGEEPKNIGLTFRQGSNELTLIFASGGLVEATFNGKNSGGGTLESKAAVETEAWKSKYAEPELAVK